MNPFFLQENFIAGTESAFRGAAKQLASSFA
jgi:hypothetical protein